MGNDEASILAFGMRPGNEDFASRDVVFNMVFAQAYPCILIVNERHIYSENVWLFQTEIKKGLDKNL